ncbi:MAG: hypothetical protein AVDCRST_MAG08-1917, partial [uncultured Acetobacteraceae bacterium]
GRTRFQKRFPHARTRSLRRWPSRLRPVSNGQRGRPGRLASPASPGGPRAPPQAAEAKAEAGRRRAAGRAV